MQSPAFRVSGISLAGGGVETSTSTAKDARRIPDQWALAGVSNIRITDARQRARNVKSKQAGH